MMVMITGIDTVVVVVTTTTHNFYSGNNNNNNNKATLVSVPFITRTLPRLKVVL